MDWQILLILILGTLLVLMLTGMPVAFCFLTTNVFGAIIIFGQPGGLQTLILNISSSLTAFTLVAVPLFILMGEVVFHGGLAIRMVNAIDIWFGRMPGRLGLLAVGAATLFSTMSGSSMATTGVLGTILLPEMTKRGYRKPIAIGPIVGSGGLAMMIPPSALGVLLASLAKISVAKLLIGGVVPGLIMAFLYAIYIYGRCRIQPSCAPSYDVSHVSLHHKLFILVKDVLPLGLLIFLVIGFIFLGIATPSESAAMGVFGAVSLTIGYRGFTWLMIKKSLLATLKVTAMVFMLIAGSITFSQILAFSGASAGLLKVATELFQGSPIFLLISMQIFLLFLGCFMDNLSIMMITLPIYMPIAKALGWDLIWFCILILINVETALISPPFGLNLYVMKSVAPSEVSMADIFKAAVPFLICNFITMAIIMASPQIALWLPNLMR